MNKQKIGTAINKTGEKITKRMKHQILRNACIQIIAKTTAKISEKSLVKLFIILADSHVRAQNNSHKKHPAPTFNVMHSHGNRADNAQTGN